VSAQGRPLKNPLSYVGWNDVDPVISNVGTNSEACTSANYPSINNVTGL